MFARVMGKFNKSETLYFKRCPCGKKQLGVDLLNPSKASMPRTVITKDHESMVLVRLWRRVRPAARQLSRRAPKGALFFAVICGKIDTLANLFAYIEKNVYLCGVN